MAQFALERWRDRLKACRENCCWGVNVTVGVPMIVQKMLATIAAFFLSCSSMLAEPDNDKIPIPKSAFERNLVEAAMKTESSATDCTARIQSFIEELEALFPHANSVYPIQALFKKYFPIEGCDPDQVLAACQRSKYCSDQSARPDSLIVAFDSRPDAPHAGLYVQFSVDRKSGNTRLPFVKVKI
jgi:hypothetical protein